MSDVIDIDEAMDITEASELVANAIEDSEYELVDFMIELYFTMNSDERLKFKRNTK